MEKEKAEKITWMVKWIRIAILALFLTVMFGALGE